MARGSLALLAAALLAVGSATGADADDAAPTARSFQQMWFLHQRKIEIHQPAMYARIASGARHRIDFAATCDTDRDALLSIPEIGARHHLSSRELQHRSIEFDFPEAHYDRDVSLSIVYPCCRRKWLVFCEQRYDRRVVTLVGKPPTAAPRPPLPPRTKKPRPPTTVRPTAAPVTPKPTAAPIPRATVAPRTPMPTAAATPRPTAAPVTLKPTAAPTPRPPSAPRTKAPRTPRPRPTAAPRTEAPRTPAPRPIRTPRPTSTPVTPRPTAACPKPPKLDDSLLKKGWARFMPKSLPPLLDACAFERNDLLRCAGPWTPETITCEQMRQMTDCMRLELADCFARDPRLGTRAGVKKALADLGEQREVIMVLNFCDNVAFPKQDALEKKILASPAPGAPVDLCGRRSAAQRSARAAERARVQAAVARVEPMHRLMTPQARAEAKEKAEVLSFLVPLVQQLVVSGKGDPDSSKEMREALAYLAPLIQKGATAFGDVFGTSADGGGVLGFVKLLVSKFIDKEKDPVGAFFVGALGHVAEKVAKILSKMFGTSAQGGGMLGLIKKMFPRFFRHDNTPEPVQPGILGFLGNMFNKVVLLLGKIFGTSEEGRGLLGVVKKLFPGIFGESENPGILGFIGKVMQKFTDLLGRIFGTSAEGKGLLGFVKKMLGKLAEKMDLAPAPSAPTPAPAPRPGIVSVIIQTGAGIINKVFCFFSPTC